MIKKKANGVKGREHWRLYSLYYVLGSIRKKMSVHVRDLE